MNQEQNTKENTSCARTYATFVVRSTEIQPEEITNTLNLEPSFTRKNGDKTLGKNIAINNLWKFTTLDELESKDINDHFKFLFNIIDEKKGEINELSSKGCEFYFFVLWESQAYGGFGGGPTLDVHTMSKAVELNAKILFDIYFDFPSMEEEDDKNEDTEGKDN